MADYSEDTGKRPAAIEKIYEDVAATHRIGELVKALAHERLLLPVVPHGRECGGSDGFVSVEVSMQRMAIEAFTDIDSLQRAYPSGRPRPLPAQHVCLAALHRGGRVVIDSTFIVPRPAVAALGQGDTWLPAWDDDELGHIVHTIASRHEGIDTATIAEGPDSTDLIRIHVKADCSRPHHQVKAVIKQLMECERLIVACDVMTMEPVVVH
ncbi:MAG: SseB family protein [Actinomycetaceae bacterium]|nr:SseB family protein [Actinomycetaceae bacterium]